MKIWKLWKCFEADHSSTNYHFYSSIKALNKKDIVSINSFSSRADATKHSVKFSYYGDFADLPDGAQDTLLTKYFDIMVKESYDWWELVLVIPYNSSLFDKLKEYDCEDENELGISISKDDNQILLSIFCVLNYEEVYYLAYEDITLNDEKTWGPHISKHDSSPFLILANLLIRLKNEIINGTLTTIQNIAAFFDPERFNKPKDCTELCDMFDSALGRI